MSVRFTGGKKGLRIRKEWVAKTTFSDANAGLAHLLVVKPVPKKANDSPLF